eukprot:1114061-Pyramimonas_sp.AAC.1
MVDGTKRLRTRLRAEPGELPRLHVGVPRAPEEDVSAVEHAAAAVEVPMVDGKGAPLALRVHRHQRGRKHLRREPIA